MPGVPEFEMTEEGDKAGQQNARRIETLKRLFPEAVLGAEQQANSLKLTLKPEGLPQVCETLRDHPDFRFDYLADLTAVDARTEMRMVYRLFSTSRGDYAQVIVPLDVERPSVPSVAPVWPGADWQERECFDLFGVHFDGHEDLRRILLPDDWVGHPLRKAAEGEQE